MKKQVSVLSLLMLAVVLLSVAPFASAHERDTFKIGDRYYLITIGSLNEPFVVDNLSGVDFRVAQLPGPSVNGANGESGKGTPVTGLEQSLKVELIAGDKKQTLALEPSEKAPGSYAANFIPTVQTTYNYRIFGTMNSNPVDLTFSCVAGEVSESTQDNAQVKVSDSITRLNKMGAFECPTARRTMGFPEPALSSYELNQNIQNLEASAQTVSQQLNTARAIGIAGFMAGLAGLVVASIAWKRK